MHVCANDGMRNSNSHISHEIKYLSKQYCTVSHALYIVTELVYVYRTIVRTRQYNIGHTNSQNPVIHWWYTLFITMKVTKLYTGYNLINLHINWGNVTVITNTYIQESVLRYHVQL